MPAFIPGRKMTGVNLPLTRVQKKQPDLEQMWDGCLWLGHIAEKDHKILTDSHIPRHTNEKILILCSTHLKPKAN